MAKKILLVDDQSDVKRSISRVLMAEGYEITMASNGAEGLEKLKGESFDLVVTDILMPEMDGSEFLITVRDSGSTQKIIAISGGSNMVPQEEALRLAHKHADKVMMKPVDNDDLVQTVKGLIGQ